MIYSARPAKNMPNIVLNLIAPRYLYFPPPDFHFRTNPWQRLKFNYPIVLYSIHIFWRIILQIFARRGKPASMRKSGEIRLRDLAGRDAQLRESLLQPAASARTAQRWPNKTSENRRATARW
jgi:hypothetical protein